MYTIWKRLLNKNSRSFNYRQNPECNYWNTFYSALPGVIIMSSNQYQHSSYQKFIRNAHPADQSWSYWIIHTAVIDHVQREYITSIILLTHTMNNTNINHVLQKKESPAGKLFRFHRGGVEPDPSDNRGQETGSPCHRCWR